MVTEDASESVRVAESPARWSGIVVFAIGLAACGSSGGGSKTPIDPTMAGVSAGPFSFSVSPVALDQIRYIVPLGNLNPPGHTLPTDHIYFFIADPNAGESPVARRTDFFAPADGTVYSVIPSEFGDVGVSMRSTTRVSYTIAHLMPSVTITTGTQIHAGDRLGTTGGVYAIDLGVQNLDVTIGGLLNLSRYPVDEQHVDAPLKYFPEPLRTQLYAKVQRLGSDRDGKFDFDVQGRLSGNWFGETDASQQIAFSYDTYDPGAVRISISSGLSLAPAVFGVAATDPIPRDVSVGTGAVSYTIFRASAPAPVGHLLAQLVGDGRIRVEVFSPMSVPATEFTAAATTYVR